MSAGVEILLLVVPVCVWIIDWSYCRVIPKDEHCDGDGDGGHILRIMRIVKRLRAFLLKVRQLYSM